MGKEFNAQKLELVNAGGESLQQRGDARAKEMSADLQPQVEQQEKVQRQSESVFTKARDIFGGARGAELRAEAARMGEGIERRKAVDAEYLRHELEQEARAIVRETVTDPLGDIAALYRSNADTVHQRSFGLPDRELKQMDLKIAEQKLRSGFSFENAQTLFSDRELRKDYRREFEDFFDFKRLGGRDVLSSIEKKDADRDSYAGAEGLVLEIAESALAGLHASIEKDGLSGMEDDPGLFRMLDSLARVMPDAFARHDAELVELFIERGMNGSVGALLQLDELNRVALESVHAERFKARIAEKLDMALEERNWSELELACRASTEVLYGPGLERLGRALEQYGIALDEVRDAWDLYPFRGIASFMNIEANFRMFEKLEAERPGIVRALMSEFSIKEFRRYPAEVLIEQFDKRDADVPYGVLVFTNCDHEQAFDANDDLVRNVFEQTRDHGLAMRVVEFDSRKALMRRFADLDSRYGAEHKIAYVWFGGHGSQEEFQTEYFGPGMKKRNFDNAMAKKAKGFFVDRPEIVLSSCSTGADDGIGQKISETYEARVYAPATMTSTKSLDAEFSEEGELSFRMRYGHDVLRVYDKGELSQAGGQDDANG